jgi:hypothetical protein
MSEQTPQSTTTSATFFNVEKKYPFEPRGNRVMPANIQKLHCHGINVSKSGISDYVRVADDRSSLNLPQAWPEYS